MNETITCPDNKTICDVFYKWQDYGFCNEYLATDCLDYPCQLQDCYKVPVAMPGYCKNQSCYEEPDPIPPIGK